jgi:uncharacterized protein YycO
MKPLYKILLLLFVILIASAVFIYSGLHQMSAEDKEVNPADLGVELRNGDIIFQTSLSAQSKAIQLATKSKYSHMGMLYQDEGQWYVYEAVQPVKKTPIAKWIARGENGHYVIKRLKNSEQVLTPETLKKMKAAGEKYKGKDYDIYFGWSDEKIYCSELVWKIYKEATGIEIGKLQTLEDFDLSHPAVQKKMKERYGNAVPENELVISPAAMFNSVELETVGEE